LWPGLKLKTRLVADPQGKIGFATSFKPKSRIFGRSQIMFETALRPGLKLKPVFESTFQGKIDFATVFPRLMPP
jgi:hypothetical protein